MSISILQTTKIQAIYTIVEDEIIDQLDMWNNEAFCKELDNRITDLESGKVKGSLPM